MAAHRILVSFLRKKHAKLLFFPSHEYAQQGIQAAHSLFVFFKEEKKASREVCSAFIFYLLCLISFTSHRVVIFYFVCEARVKKGPRIF